MSESTYTSNLLCHFVGRSMKTDIERFELLISIIRGKKLLANVSDPQKLTSHYQSGYQCEHAGEVFGKCDCVCFCDIPDSSLGIHTNKYSKFGIGFEKTFIAEQGAHPVMYIPKNYRIVERGDGTKEGQSSSPRNPMEYFPYLLKVTVNLLPLMELGYIRVDLLQQENLLRQSGLENHLNLFDDNVRTEFFSGKYHSLIYNILQGAGNQMAYIKLYDATLPDEDPNNYYMEREWRSLKNIVFSIDNIKTIYLPSTNYRDNFLQEFPEYTGTFYFLGE